MYDKTITRTYCGYLDIGKENWVTSVGNVNTACEPTGYLIECPYCGRKRAWRQTECSSCGAVETEHG